MVDTSQDSTYTPPTFSSHRRKPESRPEFEAQLPQITDLPIPATAFGNRRSRFPDPTRSVKLELLRGQARTNIHMTSTTRQTKIKSQRIPRRSIRAIDESPAYPPIGCSFSKHTSLCLTAFPPLAKTALESCWPHASMSCKSLP